MARLTLWVFVVALGLDLGAGIYEARIVVPLWAGGVPATLAAGNAYGRVAIDAGVRFWAYMTSAVALFAILSLVLGWCRTRWLACRQRPCLDADHRIAGSSSASARQVRPHTQVRRPRLSRRHQLAGDELRICAIEHITNAGVDNARPHLPLGARVGQSVSW